MCVSYLGCFKSDSDDREFQRLARSVAFPKNSPSASPNTVSTTLKNQRNCTVGDLALLRLEALGEARRNLSHFRSSLRMVETTPREGPTTGRSHSCGQRDLATPSNGRVGPWRPSSVEGGCPKRVLQKRRPNVRPHAEIPRTRRAETRPKIQRYTQRYTQRYLHRYLEREREREWGAWRISRRPRSDATDGVCVFKKKKKKNCRAREGGAACRCRSELPIERGDSERRHVVNSRASDKTWGLFRTAPSSGT